MKFHKSLDAYKLYANSIDRQRLLNFFKSLVMIRMNKIFPDLACSGQRSSKTRFFGTFILQIANFFTKILLAHKESQNVNL